VLLVYADHAHGDGSGAWPSADTIAYEGRMARATAVACRKRLVADGRLVAEPDDGDRPPGLRSYRVRMDIAAEGPPPRRGRTQAEKFGGKDPVPHKGVRSSGDGGKNHAAQGGNEALPEPSRDNRPPNHPSCPTADAAGPDVPPEVHHLCALMADLQNERFPRPRAVKPTYRVIDRWLRDMDRLLRLDGVTPAEAEAALRWVHTHNFWRKIILCPANLREKWDRLRADAADERNGRKGGQAAEVDRQAARLRAGLRANP
jgi:hypothetical protein